MIVETTNCPVMSRRIVYRIKLELLISITFEIEPYRIDLQGPWNLILIAVERDKASSFNAASVGKVWLMSSSPSIVVEVIHSLT